MIYRLLEKGFLKYLLKKQKRKIEIKDLNFEFADKNGYKYYSFAKEISLPITRLAKLQEYIMWIQKGVDIEEYSNMLDAMDKALTDGILNKKNASKIGFIISELRDRKTMVLHDELFYNFIAVQLIRSDEISTEFNNGIQLEKVAALKDLNNENDGFFLIIQKYLGALNLLGITKNELDKLLVDTALRKQALHRILTSL